MSFNLQVKIDTSDAPTAVTKVGTALTSLETSAKSAGDAATKAMKDISSAAKDSSSTASTAANAFAGLTEQFKREADMLDKIRGPAKEYNANLQALDMLLQKNSISTSEYADQVTKMNAAIDGTKQKTEEASGPADKLSGALGAIAMPAIGAGILGLGEKIGSLVTEMHAAEDAYTNLANKAQKFTDAAHNATQVLDEEQAMSVKLHTTMAPVIDLYDKVRIGADGLRVSHEDLLRMTQTLGEGVQLANKPIEEAGGLMERFAFAMESGVTSTRDVKSVMREMPEVAGIWRDTFHLTDQQILTMVQNGKLGARELAIAWTQNGDAVKKVDDDWLRRNRTNQQALDEWKEKVSRAQNEGVSNPTAAASADPSSLLSQVSKNGFNTDQAANGQAAQKVIDDVMKQGDNIVHLTGQWKDLGAQQDKTTSAGIVQLVELTGKVELAGDALLDVGRKFGVLADSWDQGFGKVGKSIQITMEQATKIGNAKIQLDALAIAMKNGGIAGDDARKKYEALETTINDGRLPATIKVFDSLHEPMRTWQEDMAATTALYKAGTISVTDYQYELVQLAKTDPGLQRFDAILADNVKHYDEAAAAAKRYRDAAKLGFDSPANAGIETGITGHQMNRDALTDAKATQGASDYGAAAQAVQEKSYQEAIDASATAVDKYYQELGKLNQAKATLSTDQYATALQNLNEKFTSTESPSEKLLKQIQDLNGFFGAGALSFDAYTKGMNAVAKEQEKLADSGKDFASGLSRGWHSIRDEVNDTASTIASSMKGAFDEINGDIVTMVTTGTADWGKLATTIETDLAKMALQKIEASAIGLFSSSGPSALGSTASAAATGTATGTSAAATLAAAAPGIGATLGAAAAAVIQAGAAGSGVTSGLAAGGTSAAVNAARYGADFDVPYYAASGANWVVGGQGPTDSKMAMFHVTPGEHVSVKTPEQMNAARNASGGGGGGNVKIVNQSDERGALAGDLATGVHDKAILNVMQRNRNSVQAMLRK